MKPAALAFLACALATPACAGEATCWYENGVVVVTAEVMGVTGDFILDTGSPVTQLAETQAQAAGYEEPQLRGQVRLAGLALEDRPVAVADIDVRTGLLPTHIAGIIGVDSLRDLVLDLTLTPCRLSLYPPAQAPPVKPLKTVPMTWIAGRPTVPAAVSDGIGEEEMALVVSTGADAPVRVSEVKAGAPGAAKPEELFPYGVLRPKLAALVFAGHVWRDLRGGLLRAAAGVDGEIGAPLFVGLTVRFDFPGGRLLLANPNEKGPDVRRAPDQSRR